MRQRRGSCGGGSRNLFREANGASETRPYGISRTRARSVRLIRGIPDRATHWLRSRHAKIHTFEVELHAGFGFLPRVGTGEILNPSGDVSGFRHVRRLALSNAGVLGGRGIDVGERQKRGAARAHGDRHVPAFARVAGCGVHIESA